MGEWSQATAADYARYQADSNDKTIKRLTADIEELKQRVTKLEAKLKGKKKCTT